jgi:hypothetical protein
MGGENREIEIADFPRLGKRMLRNGDRLRSIRWPMLSHLARWSRDCKSRSLPHPFNSVDCEIKPDPAMGKNSCPASQALFVVSMKRNKPSEGILILLSMGVEF